MDEPQERIVRTLHSEDFLDVIRTFLNLVESCMGPKGGIKIFITSGGISVTTSSSSRMLNHYIFSHPMCILVSQVMKSQTTVFGDYGFYTGVLAMRLLELPLKQTVITQSQASKLIHSASSQVFSLLKHDSIKLQLDFNSVAQLIPIVRTILSSKPSCGLSKKEIDSLCVQVVKVFLNSVNEDFGDVVIQKGVGVEGISIISGTLYQIDVEEKFVQSFVLLTTKTYSRNIPLLLFNIMLTDIADKQENGEINLERNCDILKDATCIIERAIKMGVKIVACQKVVHDSLRLLLQRNNILLLDRLGSELCRVVSKISFATPISTLKNISMKNLQSCVGTVDSTKYVTYGSKSYVVLEKSNSNVATVLLQSSNDEAFTELKIVIQQSLKALRQVTCQPFILPGAGCLEMWLASQLRLQDAPEIHVLQFQKAVVGWLQKSLISITQVLKTPNLYTAADTTFCHSWSSWDPDASSTCSCGLVCTSDVKAAGGTWLQPNIFANNDLVFPNPNQFLAQPINFKKTLEAAIVDVYISKCNAIKLALDTSVNMLSVGVMIFKPSV